MDERVLTQEQKSLIEDIKEDLKTLYTSLKDFVEQEHLEDKIVQQDKKILNELEFKIGRLINA